MAKTGASAEVWTEADTEGLFTFIGKYVVIFQWIEGMLDHILLLAWGHENWTKSQTWLAKMTNYAKVEAVKTIVFTSPEFARVHTRPNWCTQFDYVIGRLHRERVRRNELVHSQFVLELADAGLVPLSSVRQRLDGEVVFTQKELNKKYQEKMLVELGQLAQDVKFIHVQLVHDYRAPVSP